MSIDRRASLVPAAAVIPAPIAYTNVVAVKKLVVGPRVRGCSRAWSADRSQPQVRGFCFKLVSSSDLALRRALVRSVSLPVGGPEVAPGYNPLHSAPALHTRDQFSPLNPSLFEGGSTLRSDHTR